MGVRENEPKGKNRAELRQWSGRGGAGEGIRRQPLGEKRQVGGRGGGAQRINRSRGREGPNPVEADGSDVPDCLLFCCPHACAHGLHGGTARFRSAFC